MLRLDITLLHLHIVSTVPWFSANTHGTHVLNDICRTTDVRSFVNCMVNPNHDLTQPDLTYGASWNASHIGRTRQTCMGDSPERVASAPRSGEHVALLLAGNTPLDSVPRKAVSQTSTAPRETLQYYSYE